MKRKISIAVTLALIISMFSMAFIVSNAEGTNLLEGKSISDSDNANVTVNTDGSYVVRAAAGKSFFFEDVTLDEAKSYTYQFTFNTPMNISPDGYEDPARERWFHDVLIPIRHGKAADAAVEDSVDGHYIRLNLEGNNSNSVVRAWLGTSMEVPNPGFKEFHDFELLADTNYTFKVVSEPTSFDLYVNGEKIKTVTGLPEVENALIGFGFKGLQGGGALPAEDQNYTISDISLIDMSQGTDPGDNPDPIDDPDPVDGQLIPTPNPCPVLPETVIYDDTEKSFNFAAGADVNVFLNTQKAILDKDKTYTYELTVNISDLSGNGHIYIPVRHTGPVDPQTDEDIRGGHYIALWLDSPKRVRMGCDLRTFEYGETPFTFYDTVFEANTDYDIKIISAPTEMQVYLNGELIKSLTGLPKVDGVVGFGGNQNTKAFKVSNISLKESTAPGPVIPEDEGNEPEDNDEDNGEDKNTDTGQSVNNLVFAVLAVAGLSVVVFNKKRIKR